MREGEPGSVIRRARSRSRSAAVWSALRVIFALMFFSALGGLALGMWEEVAASPQKYQDSAGRRRHSDTPLLAKWSVTASTWVLELQGRRPKTPKPLETAWKPEPYQPPPPRRVGQPPSRLPAEEPREPIVAVPLEPPPKPSEPAVVQPEVTPEPALPEVPPVEMPEPEIPRPGYVGVGGLPANPTRPAKITAPPGVDDTAAELLEKAHEKFDLAWGYCIKAGPQSPAGGRKQANDQAIRYLKEAKTLYEAVRARQIPAELHKRIEARMVEVNRLLFWSVRFRGV